MDNQVFIQCDGNSEIGLGHLIRCISLAHMLREDFKISFFCLSIPASIKQEIKQEGWTVHSLASDEEFEKYLSGLQIVVLDGYQFDSNYQKRIKDKAKKLVYIDDFHNQHMYADLVINHAPGVTEDDYEGEPYTRYLLGPKYALLRPEFLKNKRASTKEIDEIKRLLICFGGSDIKNLTAKVLSWLPSRGYTFTVILGSAYNLQSKLEEVIEERKDLKIVIRKSLNAEEMREEIEKADLAIVPASGILFEVIATSIPAISGYYVSNQKMIYDGFKKLGCFLDAYDFDKVSFTNCIDSLSVEKLKEIKAKQNQAIDQKSNQRLLEEFKRV
jgi:UDP-2,4-diacetamido-2,4,6-trideoxy-beta-L-altropyranose hydrolase